MNLAKSNELEDSLSHAKKRYQEVCLKIDNGEYSNAVSKHSLFPNKKPIQPPIRASMVRRTCLKKTVVSSTPMTCTKKKQFTSDSLSSMSPISNETSQKKLNSSEKNNNNDSVMYISSSSVQKDKKNKNDEFCNSRQSTDFGNYSKVTNKQEHLNEIISKIRANSKLKEKEQQTSFRNFELQQKNSTRRHVKSLARNLFNNSLVDCEIQTGPSLTKIDTERYSLDEVEQILTNCEKDKKFDSEGPWRAPSGLQPYEDPDQDSLSAINSLLDEDTSNDTFVPKLVLQKKLSVYKKKRGRPRKDENSKRQNVADNVVSVCKSPITTKLRNKSQFNNSIVFKNKKKNTIGATTSRMVQTDNQIKDTRNNRFCFGDSTQLLREKQVNLSSQIKTENSKKKVDQLSFINTNATASKTSESKSPLENSINTVNTEVFNVEIVKSLSVIPVGISKKIVKSNRKEEDEIDVPLTENEISESTLTNTDKRNITDSVTVKDHQTNIHGKKSSVITNGNLLIDSTPLTTEEHERNFLKLTSLPNEVKDANYKDLKVVLTRIECNGNKRKGGEIEQRTETAVSTGNTSQKHKRGRPKKKTTLNDMQIVSTRIEGNENKRSSDEEIEQRIETAVNIGDTPQKLKRGRPKKKIASSGEAEQNEVRRSTRERRPLLKLTSHVVLYTSQKALNKVEKNAPKQSFINLSNDQMSVNTLFYNAKLLSPVEENENENSEAEGVQEQKAVSRKNRQSNKINSGKIRKRRNVKQKQNKIVSALNKTLDQRIMFDTVLNLEDDSHVGTRWFFKNPKFKTVANMDGITTFTIDGVGTGLIQIDPRKVKPKQCALNYDLTFVVVQGHANVEIQDECCTFSKLGVFVVRQGANYYIENISDTETLVLVFSRFKLK